MPIIIKPGKIHIPSYGKTIYFNLQIGDSLTNLTSEVAKLMELNVTRRTLRRGLDSFKIKFTNPDRYFIDRYDVGDYIKAFIDYTDGTYEIIRGRIEAPDFGYSNNGFYVSFFGRNTPEIKDRRITISFDGTSGYVAIKTIIDKYCSSYLTYNNMGISELSTAINANYIDQTILSIIADILLRNDADGYIEQGDLKTFADTGVTNSSEAINYGQNLVNISQFGRESIKEKNRVKVIGSVVEEVVMIYTSQLAALTPWQKDSVVNKGNIRKIADTKERADAVLAEVSDTTRKSGTATAIFLKTLKPGEIISVVVPGCDIDNDYYIEEFTHNLTAGKIVSTSCSLSRAQEKDTDIFLETKEDIEGLSPSNNPNGMETTLIYLNFRDEDDIDTMTDVSLSQQKLVLDSGQSQGTMISNAFSHTTDWTKCELRGIRGEDTRISEFYVSNDNGVTYQQITNFEDEVSLTTTGRVGRIKVILKTDSDNLQPEINSIGLLVKE